MDKRDTNQEDKELDRAYRDLTGSAPGINNGGCGCLPFITITLVGLILLFLMIAGIALLIKA
jgi:hypothetical protein